VLVATVVVCLVVDVFTDEREPVDGVVARRHRHARRHGPAVHPGTPPTTPGVMFGGGYVVDDFSLVLKGLFLVAGYVSSCCRPTTSPRATTPRASTTLLLSPPCSA
jgi:hypothetical protein